MPAATEAEAPVLYGTSACHLCEVAEEMLQALQAAGWALDVCVVQPYDYLVERPLGRL